MKHNRLPTDDGKQPSSAVQEKKPMDVPSAVEIGGPEGPEPTLHGDWQFKGKCVDF